MGLRESGGGEEFRKVTLLCPLPIVLHISITTVPFLPFADHPELDAQVPATVPPGEGERHPSASLLHLQDLRLQGDPHHYVGGLKMTLV